MVQFAKELLDEQIAEWQPYYMSYTKLKGFLSDMEANASDESIDQFFKARESFFEELKINLTRVSLFYSNREKVLHAMLREAFENGTKNDSREMRRIEGQAMCDEAERLKQFAHMNHEGFRKITKKYDKQIGDFERRHQPAGGPDSNKSLKDRTMALLVKHEFTNSEDRLQAYLEKMEKWRDGEDVSLPALNQIQKSISFRRISRSDTDLDIPLMGYKRRDRSIFLQQYRGKMYRFMRAHGISCLMTIFFTAAECYSWYTEAEPKLKFTGYFTMWVTFISLVLLVKQYPPEAVMVTATLILTVCGIVEEKNAWAAFSSEVVLSVAGLGAIASCVGATGVIEIVFFKIVGRPKTLWVAMLRLIIPSSILNCGVSNTCVMSCLLPVIDKWCADIGHHKAYFLMPLSYILLISGAVCIFSTSTNLVAQELLTKTGFEPFGMFDLAVPVIVCTLAIIAYLVIFGPFFLSRFANTLDPKAAQELAEPMVHDGKSRLRRGDNRFDIRIQVNGRALVGQTLKSSGIIEKLQGDFDDIILCIRFGQTIIPEDESLTLELSDVLVLNTTLESMKQLRNHTPGVTLIPQDCSEIKQKSDYAARELVEVVLDKPCPLLSHRMRHANKYSSYGASIVAFRAFDDSGYNPQEPPQERRLEHGDHLVFDCPPEFFEQWNDSGDFIFTKRVFKGKSLDDDRPTYAATLSGCILLSMVAVVASSVLPLFEGVMYCLTALVLTRCVTLETVIKAVKLRTVLTIVGAFGLGQAIRTENIALVLAQALLKAFGWAGPRGILLAIFCATVALGVVFHGTAVVVLMFPICQKAAEEMDPPIPVHQVVALLCIAVTGQMLSPISYQTNIMAYTSGGYEFADFTKTGVGCVVLLAICGIFMCELWFPASTEELLI